MFHPMVQWEVCLWADVFECLCTSLSVCVCVQCCFTHCVCLWINWAWRMMTTFIARPIKKNLPACRAWNMTPALLVGPYIYVLSFRLLLLHTSQFQDILLCARHWVVNKCMLCFWLLNASVLHVSAPQMPYPVWERFRGFRFVLFFLLHLFNDPDIAMEHTNCTLGHTFSCHRPSPALLLNHCACERLYRKDCTTCL